MKTKKTTITYALVPLIVRVAIEHTDDYDALSIIEGIEIKKATVEIGKVISADVVEVGEDIEIVECQEDSGNPDACACDRQD